METMQALELNQILDWRDIAEEHAARVAACKGDDVTTFTLLWRDARVVRLETTGIHAAQRHTVILTAHEPSILG